MTIRQDQTEKSTTTTSANFAMPFKIAEGEYLEGEDWYIDVTFDWKGS